VVSATANEGFSNYLLFFINLLSTPTAAAGVGLGFVFLSVFRTISQKPMQLKLTNLA